MYKRILRIAVAACLVASLISGCAVAESNNECEKNIINALYEKAQMISEMFVYGEGVPLSSGIEAIIQSPTGNCSQTAYAIARYAENIGLETRIVSLYSSNGMNHAVCEASIDNKWIVIDASNGVIIPYSAGEVYQNPLLLKQRIGTPKAFSKVYQSDYFWADIQRIEYHRLSEYEHPIPVEVVSYSNCFYEPENSIRVAFNNSMDSGYTASIEGTEGNVYVIITLKEADYVNRIAFEWYDGENRATDLSVYTSDDGKKFVNVKRHVEKEDQRHSQYLELPINKSAKYIKLEFKEFSGQNRLLVRKIQVFSDFYEWSRIYTKQRLDDI